MPAPPTQKQNVLELKWYSRHGHREQQCWENPANKAANEAQKAKLAQQEKKKQIKKEKEKERRKLKREEEKKESRKRQKEQQGQ